MDIRSILWTKLTGFYAVLVPLLRRFILHNRLSNHRPPLLVLSLGLKGTSFSWFLVMDLPHLLPPFMLNINLLEAVVLVLALEVAEAMVPVSLVAADVGNILHTINCGG